MRDLPAIEGWPAVLVGAARLLVTGWIVSGQNPKRHSRTRVRKWIDARWQTLSEKMTRGAIT